MILELLTILAMGTTPLPSEPPPVAHEQPRLKTAREKVLDVAKSTLAWREASGRNDGPEIERILSVVGLQGTGSPYCAVYCVFCYESGGVGSKIPHSAWSPDLVKNPSWLRGHGETPRPSDVFGIWFNSKGRVAHVGLIEKWGDGAATTIEGNTGPGSSSGTERDREGEGVFKRWRPTMSIYSVKSYL